MSTADRDLYAVKVRRHYGQNEATSVLYGPVNRAKAEERLALLVGAYQDPDAYYIEKWEREKIK